MNISGYIAANTWGYDVAKASQTTSTKKSYTHPTEELADEKQTQKNLNNAGTNPFTASSFNFKDWCANLDTSFDNHMYTKTESTRSDEEILKDMAELARKHAQQGTFQEQDEEFLALMKEYMSSVSPDREGILNSAINKVIGNTNQDKDYTMSAIYQQINAQGTSKKEKEKDEKELIDYLLEMLKSRGYGKVGSSETTSNDETASNDVQFNSSGMIFTDENGEMIATFNGDGLHSSTTTAEVERRKEVLAAYNAGYDFATGNNSALHPGFSESYKEIYNSTYDRLTNNIVA